MKRNRAFAGLVAVVLAAGPAASSAQSQEVDPRVARVESGLRPPVQIRGQESVRWSLAERMEHYDVPGVSIAVLDEGELAWARGYGMADPELERPVTPETLFQAASISKPVAAMAALSLVEEGVLDLDQDVNRYLKRWKVPGNRFTEESPVTLRWLLSHTGGMTVGGFPGYSVHEELPGVIDILDGEGNTPEIRVDTLPGSRWRYSGGGYTVVQLLLEEVTGQPFARVVRDRVLEPAGMVHSTYVQPLPEELHGFASHAFDLQGEKIEGAWHVYPEQAAAGLWTTPADLARLAVEVQRSFRGESHRVLSAGMTREMLTEVRNGYGLGFGLQGTGPEKRFVHGGANAGFKSQFVGWVEGGRGAFVMANGEQGSSLIREVIFAIADAYGWPEPEPRVVRSSDTDPARLHELAGSYRVTAWDFRIELFVRGGRLWLRFPNGPAQELIPTGREDWFVNLRSGDDVVFGRDAEGKVVRVRVDRDIRAVREGG